jgi:uncharacterized protein (DUF1697 family)
MPRSRNVHIALLRGINVGKAKRIAMADLRELAEGLGYRDVKTILNSGNIVYVADRGSAEQSAARIEKALLTNVGLSSRITGLTAQELDEIIADNPLPDAIGSPSRFLIAITSEPSVLAALGPLRKHNWGGEVLAVGKRAAYMWCPEGILGGSLVEAVGRALGDNVTTRNWATCNRIAAVAADILA